MIYINLLCVVISSIITGICLVNTKTSNRTLLINAFAALINAYIVARHLK